MVETAEKLIADLRTSVNTLEQDVATLSTPNLKLPPADFEHRTRIAAELITQALVKLDSVQISKDAAANALRSGDRKTSRQLSVLLARRKTISKRLNELGDAVDKLTAECAVVSGDGTGGDDKTTETVEGVNEENDAADGAQQTTAKAEETADDQP